MILNSPVSLTVNNEQIEMSNLDIFIMDHQSRKIVIARVAPFIQPIILWRGTDYDNIGDYTQAQVEAKILELLGDNSQETLQSLVIQG
jgi:hypothetical protein